MKKKPLIAIDGYSSTGKSSISKIVAQRLGLLHLDTGALYRGITLYGLQQHLANGELDILALTENLAQIHLKLTKIGDGLHLYLNGRDVSREIREPRISAWVSLVAKEPAIRSFLLGLQREIAEGGGVILDGRDIGTVVLPDADYKFFMTASIPERTRRRYLELQAGGADVTLEEVQQNLLLRDKLDSERNTAPLIKAPDAIEIDNTGLTREETAELIISHLV